MPTNRDPEQEASAALARGDTAVTITILLNSYGRLILRYCEAFLRNDDLAQDVQQTVFIQAYLSLTCFSGRAPFRVWLKAIARYRCMDARKAIRSSSRYTTQESELPDVADPALSAEQQLVASADAELLHEGLGMLPPKDRTAIIEHHLEQLSYDEMARRSGERAGTLRVRVSRALPVLGRNVRSLDARTRSCCSSNERRSKCGKCRG